MESSPAFETKTRSAVATTPEGLRPVRTNATSFAAAGVATSTMAREFDSGALEWDGPPGLSLSLPESLRESLKAGGGNSSGLGSAWYSWIPTLVTYRVLRSGASVKAKGSQPTRTEATTWRDLTSMAAMRKFA